MFCEDADAFHAASSVKAARNRVHFRNIYAYLYPQKPPVMRIAVLLLFFARFVAAQSDPGASGQKQSSVVRPLDSAAVWEGVRIKTGEIFAEEEIEPSFRIKKDKTKREELARALEAQFQVNISDDDIRSMKRAGDLSAYIFRAQNGLVAFSKAGFQGKVERLFTDRKRCKENGDCLNYIGAVIVPKGMVVTFFSQPKFRGAQMTVDASTEEVRIASFFNLTFEGPVSTTDKTVNWRESIQSLRFGK